MRFPIDAMTRSGKLPRSRLRPAHGHERSALGRRHTAVADGTDFFGSLRNPPAFNNVFGLRPSYGRVSAGPAEEIFVGQLSVPGPIGRTVSDVALLLSVMAGHDSRSPLSIEQDPGAFLEPLKRDFDGTRIAWLGNFGGYLAMEPGVLDLCQDSFKAFESIGCKIEETQPDFPPEKRWATFVTLRHWLTVGNLGHFYDEAAQREQLKPEAQWEVEGGLRLSAMDAYKASANRSSFYQVINRMFKRYAPSCIFHLTAIIPNDSTPWQGQQKGILLPQTKSTQITYFCPYPRWWQRSGRRITWITVVWVVAG